MLFVYLLDTCRVRLYFEKNQQQHHRRRFLYICFFLFVFAFAYGLSRRPWSLVLVGQKNTTELILVCNFVKLKNSVDL